MSESPTEHFEHAEHAEHVAHSGDGFLIKVSMTIALLAVVAATVGSLETLESGKAIADKNNAVLQQNKATDNWNFFQAKSIKKNLFEIAAATRPEKADDFLKEAKRYDDEGKEIMKKAQEFEHKSDEFLIESEHHEHRHHILTIAVTFLHVAIAISTIAIISKKQKWPWLASLVLGAVGIVAATYAYI